MMVEAAVQMASGMAPAMTFGVVPEAAWVIGEGRSRGFQIVD
jgi:hypothetical protein